MKILLDTRVTVTFLRAFQPSAGLSHWKIGTRQTCMEWLLIIRHVNSVNYVNSANNVNSYSAVLPPSLMVFFFFTNVLSVFAFHQNPTCSPLTSTETRSLQTKHQFRKVANGSHHFFCQNFNFLRHQKQTSEIKDHTSDSRHWDWLAWGVPAESTCFLAR